MGNCIEVIEKTIEALSSDYKNYALHILKESYPFTNVKTFHRNYTLKQKFDIFVRDGFIDRYTGERLLNPGILKILSTYFPEDFPYHPHWKMTETHSAYWELTPTIDHIIPIALGGRDEPANWVTTSMLHNQIKSNWTLEQLHWNLHVEGDLKVWDGLTGKFITLVENDNTLLKDKYIKDWYNVSAKYLLELM